MEEQTTHAEQKVKLNRGMNGNYGWEISVTDTTFNQKALKEIDEQLRKDYLE